MTALNRVTEEYRRRISPVFAYGIQASQSLIDDAGTAHQALHGTLHGFITGPGTAGPGTGETGRGQCGQPLVRFNCPSPLLYRPLATY